MTFTVIIKQEAYNDIKEAYDYYEYKQIGVGEVFLNALQKRFDDLSKSPNNYSFINEYNSKVFRDVKVKKFPFVIVFEIINETVIVYAVHNCYKHPSKKIYR